MEQKDSLLIPVAILIAGAVLSIAVYLVRVAEPISPLAFVGAIRPVSPSDHFIGNPEAKVKVVTYSDIDCQYCKEFQAVMMQLMTEYAPTGDVMWVYRHFPVINLHENADRHAEAAECVAELGGDTLFFQFIDSLQQLSPGSDQFDPEGYETVVENLGLSPEAFTACIDSNRHVERVTLDFENAAAAGGEAAPYIVILTEDKDPIVITGALPYETMKEVIEQARGTSN